MLDEKCPPLQIPMTEVASSRIHSLGYDAATATLAIRFRGKVGEATSLYHYAHVTPEDFRAFRDAASIGSYFYKHIKPFTTRFPYQRIESAPAPDNAA